MYLWFHCRQTNVIDNSNFWDTNRSWASRDIACSLWNSKIHFFLFSPQHGNCLCPETDEFFQILAILFFLRPVSIVYCHHRRYHSRSKGFRTKTMCAFVSLPSACHMPHPSYPLWFDQGVSVVITAAQFRFTQKREIFRQAAVQSFS